MYLCKYKINRLDCNSVFFNIVEHYNDLEKCEISNLNADIVHIEKLKDCYIIWLIVNEKHVNKLIDIMYNEICDFQIDGNLFVKNNKHETIMNINFKKGKIDLAVV